MLYILKDCKASKEIWLCLVAQNDHSAFFSMGMREWLVWNWRKIGSSGQTDRRAEKMALSGWWL